MISPNFYKWILNSFIDGSSTFIVNKTSISVHLQLYLDSLPTRVVSLESWILQIMVWSIITWQTSTMVPTVLRDVRYGPVSGLHLWHTCPTRHLKVQISEDTRFPVPYRKTENSNDNQASRVCWRTQWESILFVCHEGNRVDVPSNITQSSDDHHRDTLSVDHRRQTHGNLQGTLCYLLLFTFPPWMLRLFVVGRFDVLFFLKNR